MGFKVIATALAALGAFGTVALLAMPADAQTTPKKKRVAIVDARGHTVFTNRDEDGRSRTRVIIQKRSYLDPGTEVFPGENNGHNYAFSPTHSATSILDNTVAGNRSPLPGPFDLPSKNNPFLKF